jgi:hypothetical protein
MRRAWMRRWLAREEYRKLSEEARASGGVRREQGGHI